MPLAERPLRTAALLVAAALLAGCTSTSGPEQEDPPRSSSPVASDPSDPSSSSSSVAPSGAADRPVATVPLTVGGGVLDVEVFPLVRVAGPAAAPDLVALTLDLSVAEPGPDGGALSFTSDFADIRPEGLGGAGALRLLDLVSDQVHLVAADADGEGVATDRRGWSDVEPGQTARLQAFYAAPAVGVEAVSLLVPGAPLVDRVPVVDGEVPPPADDLPPPLDDYAGPDPAQVASASVQPLETFTTELDGAVRTLDTAERARVDLSTDVLFAFDSADLGPQAQQVLAAAAEDVRSREPGQVLVVGHTDDQGSQEYNLELSRARAQAIADAVGPLLGADYPVVVEARGESEPVAEGTDEQARALNRRVEMSVDAPLAAPAAAVEAAGEVPEGPDLTAPGAEGVLLDTGPRPYRVRVPSVRRVEGHVVADVQITAEDDEVGSPFGPAGVLGGPVDPRGTFSIFSTSTARSLVLLQGSTAVFSMDHLLDPDDPTARLCTCDPNTWAEMNGGQTTVSTVVFPSVDVGDEVTLQVGDRGASAFRLTEVPVS